MKDKIKKITRKQWIIGISIFILLIVIISVILVFIFSGKEKDIKMCHVQFDTLGGTRLDSIEVPCGEKVNKPNTMPEKEGFEFVSWNYLGNIFDFNNIINEDIVLQAKYFLVGDGELVTVSFNSDGGTYVQSIELIKGNTITEPINPTRVNSSFDGWYLNEEKFDFNNPINESITLVAKWSEKSHMGSAVGGNSNEECSVSYNGSPREVRVPLNYKGNIYSLLLQGFSYTGNCKITITSDNPSVMSVTKDGMLTAHNVGRAKISLFADSKNYGKEFSNLVTVEEIKNDNSAEESNTVNGIKYDDIFGPWYVEGTGQVMSINFISETNVSIKGMNTSLQESLDNSYDRNFDSFKELVTYFDIKKINSGKITATRNYNTVTLVRNQEPIKVKNIKLIDLNNDVEITGDEMVVEQKSSYYIRISVQEKYASSVKVNYSVGNSSIIKVDSFKQEIDSPNSSLYWLNFDALSLGTTTLTIRSKDGGAVRRLNVTVVKNPVDRVTIDHKNASLYVGENIKLYANVIPMSATYGTVHWSSSDPSVATVGEWGTVTAKKPGTVIITATADGVSDTSTIVVTYAPLTVNTSSGLRYGCTADNECALNWYIEIKPKGGTGVYTYNYTLTKDGVTYGPYTNNIIYLKYSGTYELNYTVTDSEGRSSSGKNTVYVGA